VQGTLFQNIKTALADSCTGIAMYTLFSGQTELMEGMTSGSIKRIDGDTALKLYQMMYDMDKLLGEHGIQYVVEGGTLLGLIRSQGILGHDDDLDLQVEDEYEYEYLFKFIKDDLNKLGYDMIQSFFGYKIFPKCGKAVQGYTWKYPSPDIFIVTRTDNRYVYKYKQAQDLFGKCYDEVNPITRQQFGEIEVWSPYDPIPYLNRCYGTDWATHIYKDYDHAKESRIKKIKTELTTEDKVPAQQQDQYVGNWQRITTRRNCKIP
jgi:LicD family protein